MFLSIGAGILAGLIGFIPFPLAGRFTRVNRSSETLSPVVFWLAGIILSLVILAAALFICKAVNAESVLSFGLSEIVAFMVATFVYIGVLVKRGTSA